MKNPGDTNLFWYVDYSLLEESHEVTPWTGREDISSLNSLISNIPLEFKDGTGVYKQTESKTINPKSEEVFFNLTGKRQIQSIKITIPGLKLPSSANNADLGLQAKNFREILNGLRLKIYWDNEENPSVDAKLSLFFGTGSFGYNNTAKNLFYGVNDNGVLYSYFPMPFKENAKVVIENNSETQANVSFEIKSKEVDYDFYNVGYFKTCEKNFYVNNFDPFESCLLSVNGSGKIVSLAFNAFGDSNDDVRFEEGDVRVYIDNSKTPQIVSCGTEDFFNGAGYFINSKSENRKGLYSNEFSGYTNLFYDQNKDRYSASMYRLFINDAMCFRDGIRFCVEHGGGERTADNPNWSSNMSTGYETLVSYYHTDVKRMTLSDTITLSNADSKTSHKYSSLNAENITLSSGYFSGFDIVSETRSGEKTTGKVSFEMNIDKNNHGVILSRIFDSTNKNISAKVYVDGELAGVWFKAGYNNIYSMTEDRFIIPERLVKEKEKVTIEIVPESESAWNAFEYSIYSLVDQKIDNEDELKEGIYNIKAQDSYLTLDSSLSLSQEVKYNSSSDFRLIKFHDGSYFITSSANGKVLNQSNDSLSSSQILKSLLGAKHRFIIKRTGSNKYTIQSAETKKYLNNEFIFTKDKYEFEFIEVKERKELVY